MSTHTILTKSIASLGLTAALLGGVAGTAGAEESASLRWERLKVPYQEDTAPTARPIWDWIRP